MSTQIFVGTNENVTSPRPILLNSLEENKLKHCTFWYIPTYKVRTAARTAVTKYSPIPRVRS